MKLRSEFEDVRSALLNRSLVLSLDTCVMNLLYKNNVYLPKDPWLMMLLFINMLSLHMLPIIKVKVVIYNKSNAFFANNLVILLIIVLRSFAPIENNMVISLLTTSHVLYDQHNVLYKPSMPLPLHPLILLPNFHLIWWCFPAWNDLTTGISHSLNLRYPGYVL